MSASHWDAAVIGAGVIGLSIALELSRRGRRVIIVERDQPGYHASRIAAGLLGTAGLPVGELPAMQPLKLDSLRRYPQFIADLESISGRDAGYHDDGTLWVAKDDDDAEQLELLHADRQQHGLTAQMLTGGEALELEPNLTGALVSGLLIEDDVQIDPRRLIGALVSACLAQGVEIRNGCEIDRASRNDDGWTLTPTSESSSTESISAALVVVSAGPWCDRIRRDAPDVEPGVEPVVASGVGPVKGQLLRLRGPHLLQRVVRTPGVSLSQRRNGELIAASSKEPEAGWDRSPTDLARGTLWDRAAVLVAQIGDFELEEQSVGIRPAVSDHYPLIGPAGDGLWIATGHYQHGILLAPATAHYLVEAIERGTVPDAIASFGTEARP